MSKLHVSQLKHGQKLKCVGDYADCIHTGTIYTVEKRKKEFFIQCDAGSHELLSTATKKGELPEFEIIDV